MRKAGAVTVVIGILACDGAEAVPAAPAAEVASPISSPVAALAQTDTASVTAPLPRFHYADLKIERSLEATCVTTCGTELGQKLAQVANRVLVWWVDVTRQLHKGDRIEVVYEVFDDPNVEPAVHAIWFHSHQLGKTVAAVRHQFDGDRFARWYDEKGAEIERRLLDSPIGEYEQITSLIGDGRGHRGVDFKAPVGTPIISPFNGWVKRKNWATRRNGNCLEVVDAKTGNSAYFLHLSGFAKGVRGGTRVKKGQLLAHSGNTGRSSAPHLHYQLERSDGRVLDPFRVHKLERRALPKDRVPEVLEALQRFGTYRTGSS